MPAMMYISTIITVISLILILLAYYGIIRYCKICYTKDCKCMSESYTKLPRVESKSKVVVSMYSTSDDIGKNNTIKSILDQTVHPDQIILVTDKDTSIPDFLKKDSIVVKQATDGFGKISALTVPLKTQKDSKTKIIVITDGVVYGPDFIESIVEESENNPDAIIFVEGYNSKEFVKGKLSSKNIDVVNVSSGILITPALFKEYLEPKSTIISNAPNAFISAMILKNKLKIKQLHYGENFHDKPKITLDEKTSLEYFAQYYNL